MTQDFFLGQLRLIAVAILAYVSGAGYLTPAGSGLATAILTPIGLLIGPWIWSLYVNVNKKLVPANSVAIEKEATVGTAVVGAHVAVPADTVKVVG